MNPAVSLVEYLRHNLRGSELFFYLLAQILGAWLGVVGTHLMFRQQIFKISQVSRQGAHLWISELIATFGLICVIAISEAKNAQKLPLIVAAYITSAYWFTSSTAFTNPALTFARMFTNSFGGMAPGHFLAFLLSQVSGAVLGYFLCKELSKMRY
jgi:glycerol uptake facilitator-like aquaporin